MTIFSKINESEIDRVIDFLLQHQAKVFLFSGEVGSGKTTLVRVFVNKLSAKDEASSPTFSLLNEYETAKGMVYHSDWYRINSPEELFDAGIMEYFNLPGLFIIEWPEVALEHVPKPYLHVKISHQEGSRTYTLEESN